MNAEEHTCRTAVLDGWSVVIESYSVGRRYYALIADRESGARIARGEGDARAAAERAALDKALARLGRTRRVERCEP